MQLTRTALVSRSGARHAVNRTTPALATAYSGETWLAVPSPAVEAMLMIAPPPRSAIGPRTSCDSRADVARVSEVGAEERAADPFGRNRALPVVEVGDDHVHALGREPFRDPGAYPVRSSRHQCGHSAEFHVGIVGPGTDIPFRSQPGKNEV